MDASFPAWLNPKDADCTLLLQANMKLVVVSNKLNELMVMEEMKLDDKWVQSVIFFKI